MIYEENIIRKKPMNVDIRVASVYPNVYKTAMSSLGYQIIYEMINEREDSWCERVVYPDTRSIESNSPLKDFDIISFSLQYEQDYFNMLEILKKAEIPLKSEERRDGKEIEKIKKIEEIEEIRGIREIGKIEKIGKKGEIREMGEKVREKNKFPLIIAGGPCATGNPLPISDFIDIFIVGEAEEVLDDFLDLYKELQNPQKQIDSFLSLKGIYIPKFNNKTQKVIVKDMNDAYQITTPIIVKTQQKEDEEFLPVFGNSILLNVSRGCTRGCRFCMSGYLYRPMRETPIEKLFYVAEEARKNTDLNKVSLIGAAVSDYSKINELTKGLMKRGFQISTPSMRIESITKETLLALKRSGAKTITIAPESIYSLRRSINKNIDDRKILNVLHDAINLEFNIKLYFLIGLPNESKEDIESLIEYIKEIDSLKTNKNSIKFSVNPMIPKPQTPMQWEGYDLKDIKGKIKYMRSHLKGINIKFDSAKMGLIQYVLSCKGKEVGELLEKSLESKISLQKWKKLSSGYDLNDDLPWKNIDIGLKKDFLIKEREKIFKGDITPWCEKEPCYNCGPCNKLKDN